MTNDYQFLPPLSGADYRALKEDIAERGIMVPIEYDQDGNVLDGYHRLRFCRELGITDFPRIVRTFASEADKRTHARRLNIARRHLNQEQRRALIADELRERPERSNNQIAEALGVSDTTVGTVRSQLEATSQIGKLETTIGADGKARPAKRPKIVGVNLGEDGAKATTMAAQEIRAKKAEIRRAERIERLAATCNHSTPFPSERRYAVLYADPPWHFEVYNEESGVERAAAKHYSTTSLDAICALPVLSLASPDATLFMWTTVPHLRESFDVLVAWGFEYKTNIVWVKDKFGLGYFVRNQHELLLVATRGDMPSPSPSNRPPSVITAPRREHSRKPDEAYEMIEAMYPSLPKIELFARRARPGWDAWGNEVKTAPDDGIPDFLRRRPNAGI
jgi:N6-adenosine-specific RNA methylase IME4/ParB-like chromosome segregation protein Spo0J